MDTSEDWANLYIEGIWKLHGTGSKIVSDQGPQFASEFTRTLHKGLNIQTALSTAHHPQTDGQTERLNQAMEAYLRIFTSYHQEDWVDLLPFAEFAYNDQKHSFTGMSPFFIQYGYDPTYEINANPINKVPAVKDRLNMMKELREETVVMLQRAQDAMSRKHDEGKEHRPYTIGDKVWLEATFLKTTAPSKKFDAKRVGPFPILDTVGHHTYKLKLPLGMGLMHNTFHETLLRPFKEDTIPGRRQKPPPPIEIEEGAE